MTDYSTNASIADIAAFLRRQRRLALLTHAKPDGDAVGSTLALARTLKRLNIEAWPVYLGPWSPRFDPIVASTPVIFEKHGCFTAAPLAEIDAAAVVDTGSWKQLADARAWLEPRSANAAIIDHHAHGDGDVAALRHIDATFASACELVAEVCRLLLGAASAAALPPDVAEALYLGIATDTGWFKYSSVKPRTLRLAADLIEAGVDHNRLYRWIEQNESPRRLLLLCKALSSLEYHADSRIALMTLTKAEIDESGASQDEIGGLTDLPQMVGSVRAVAVITELEPNLTKVSLRSKASEPGDPVFDVNKVGQVLGGGGHVHAAGAKIHLPLIEAKRLVAATLIGALP